MPYIAPTLMVIRTRALRPSLIPCTPRCLTPLLNDRSPCYFLSYACARAWQVNEPIRMTITFRTSRQRLPADLRPGRLLQDGFCT